MSFADLALISAVAVIGPLLALPRRWFVPVVVGELAAGIAFGRTGAGLIDASDPTFAFLADIGFVLIMFVVGTHVPVRDVRLRGAIRTGSVRAVAVAALAVPLALAIAALFGTGHAALYAVLLASSSAALVLPIVDSLRLGGDRVLEVLAQVAIADTACIVALPLVVDPPRAAHAALGATAVLAATALVFLLLRELERSGVRKRVHRVSEDRKFALEMRANLVILFLLAALATALGVPVLLAGFGFGLAVAAVGEPRRLARQLFALTEGFLGPLFFVWLGASLDIRALVHHPAYVGLGFALGAGAVAVHAAMRATGQPLPLAAIAAAQLGVPVAAAALAEQRHLLAPGESAALLLGALLTIAVSAVAAARTAAPVPA